MVIKWGKLVSKEQSYKICEDSWPDSASLERERICFSFCFLILKNDWEASGAEIITRANLNY